jgi:hypothetical protein
MRLNDVLPRAAAGDLYIRCQVDANLAADILRTHRIAIISDDYGNACWVLDGWRRRCSLPVQRPYLLPQIESSLEPIISDNDPGVGEMHQAVHNRIVTRPDRSFPAARVMRQSKLHPIGARDCGPFFVGRGNLVCTRESGTGRFMAKGISKPWTASPSAATQSFVHISKGAIPNRLSEAHADEQAEIRAKDSRALAFQAPFNHFFCCWRQPRICGERGCHAQLSYLALSFG